MIRRRSWPQPRSRHLWGRITKRLNVVSLSGSLTISSILICGLGRRGSCKTERGSWECKQRRYWAKYGKVFMNMFTWRYLKNISRLRWFFSLFEQEEEASARKKQVGFSNAHAIMRLFACELHMHLSACPRLSLLDSAYSTRRSFSWLIQFQYQVGVFGGRRSSCKTGAQGDDRFPFLTYLTLSEQWAYLLDWKMLKDLGALQELSGFIHVDAGRRGCKKAGVWA